MEISTAYRLRPAAARPRMVAGIPGMPPIDLDQKPLSFYEFWPPGLFYIPIAFIWIALSLRHRGATLPTVANPLFPDGGFVGEPKSRILDLVRPEGFIFSITLKYFPRVIGDGRTTLGELIARDPRAGRIAHVYLPRHAGRLGRVLKNGEVFRLNFAGSHSRGTIFRNGNAHITAEMNAAFDRVAKTIPELYFGRFDVRFPDFRRLQKGEDFTIVEINGAGGEATSIWDSRTSLGEAYRTLMKQFALLFEIGARNRTRGYRPMSLWKLCRLYRLEQQLTRNYPLTE